MRPVCCELRRLGGWVLSTANREKLCLEQPNNETRPCACRVMRKRKTAFCVRLLQGSGAAALRSPQQFVRCAASLRSPQQIEARRKHRDFESSFPLCKGGPARGRVRPYALRLAAAFRRGRRPVLSSWFTAARRWCAASCRRGCCLLRRPAYAGGRPFGTARNDWKSRVALLRLPPAVLRRGC